ncbi:MAG: HAD hydrolase-like protein [Coriobacteriia bacterium]|nr:HAD hydrolase-like protein [Coriobacteriia bacterium]
MPTQAYRAICFDLDGTLLSQDLDEFLNYYFTAVAQYMAKQGIPGQPFMADFMKGAKAMSNVEDRRTNEAVFWDTFMRLAAETMPEVTWTVEEWTSRLMDFYQNVFPAVGKDVAPDQNMIAAVDVLGCKGYPLLLTTMPLFPVQAVEVRLGWAGLTTQPFQRITTYSNSTAAKPHLEYYAENLAAMGLSGEDVLMVGNNTVEDLAFMRLGADSYLITDQLLNPINLDLSCVRHGSSAEFLAWATALPACENPVRNVETGVIETAESERVRKQCLLSDEALKQRITAFAAASTQQ